MDGPEWLLYYDATTRKGAFKFNTMGLFFSSPYSKMRLHAVDGTLVPVPLPASILLLSAGLAALGFAGQRRIRRYSARPTCVSA
ncbi:VPLPA-CTERM sorting domain-containing protein [Tabrizicola sp. WMC-M-20]|nr:VPLPA-CTERM sorting domain-containing protein [Tabrizicola sp. WMC-M-20]